MLSALGWAAAKCRPGHKPRGSPGEWAGCTVASPSGPHFPPCRVGVVVMLWGLCLPADPRRLSRRIVKACGISERQEFVPPLLLVRAMGRRSPGCRHHRPQASLLLGCSRLQRLCGPSRPVNWTSWWQDLVVAVEGVAEWAGSGVSSISHDILQGVLEVGSGHSSLADTTQTLLGLRQDAAWRAPFVSSWASGFSLSLWMVLGSPQV